MNDSSPQDDCLLAFALLPVGLCLTRERIIVACNPAFAAMFGYSTEELIGISLRPLYASEREFEDIAQRALPQLQQHGCYSDERIMQRRNGQLFWCHVAGQTLDPATPFACTAWMFEDLAEKRPLTLQFTAREREVAQLLVTGQTSKQIARVLGISHRTVEAHRASLMRRLNVSTPGEMLARLMHGAISPADALQPPALPADRDQATQGIADPETGAQIVRP